MNAPQVAVVDGVPLACPACGQTTGHLLRFQVNGAAFCNAKNAASAAPKRPGLIPATYYTEDYFSGRHADGYVDYLGAEPVLRREFARSVDFIRHYRTGGRLLELGCAYGFFLMEAARHFDVAGIELAEEAAEHCRRAGLNVVQGAADEANLAKVGHADVIVFVRCYRASPDPRRTLALCHQHLNPAASSSSRLATSAPRSPGLQASSGGS